MTRFPGKVPVVVERAAKSTLPAMPRPKHLVPFDLPMYELLGVIRKRLTLPPEQALFLFVGDSIVSAAELVGVVHEREASKDGFLYITYSGENTFGAHGVRELGMHASL
ncbi:ATG8 [Symbiodinium sp. KB8]|nr:ATG8 [Symbiodinium sp. KB8]